MLRMLPAFLHFITTLQFYLRAFTAHRGEAHAPTLVAVHNALSNVAGTRAHHATPAQMPGSAAARGLRANGSRPAASRAPLTMGADISTPAAMLGT